MVQVESSRGAAAGKDSSDPLTDSRADQKQADTSLHLCLLPHPPSPCCMLHGALRRSRINALCPWDT